LTDAHSLDSHIAPSLRTYIFLQSLSSQEISTKTLNLLISLLRCTWPCRVFVRLLLFHLIGLPLTTLFRLFDLAPMVLGTFSDRWGRRPIMLACLATLSLSCVELALVPTSAYWLLILLRCMQAAGSASTVVLGPYLVMAHCFSR